MQPNIRIHHACVFGLCAVLGVAIWHWRSDSSPAKAPAPSATPVADEALSRGTPNDARHPTARMEPDHAPRDGEMSVLQAEIEEKVSAGHFPAAHALVDTRLAAPGLSAAEKQQWQSTKLGLYGRSGDHAGMLAFMDQIIASDPKSIMAQKMAKQRAFVQDFSQRDPRDSGVCATCNGKHADGEPHLPHP